MKIMDSKNRGASLLFCAILYLAMASLVCAGSVIQHTEATEDQLVRVNYRIFKNSLTENERNVQE